MFLNNHLIKIYNIIYVVMQEYNDIKSREKVVKSQPACKFFEEESEDIKEQKRSLLKEEHNNDQHDDALKQFLYNDEEILNPLMEKPMVYESDQAGLINASRSTDHRFTIENSRFTDIRQSDVAYPQIMSVNVVDKKFIEVEELKNEPVHINQKRLQMICEEDEEDVGLNDKHGESNGRPQKMFEYASSDDKPENKNDKKLEYDEDNEMLIQPMVLARDSVRNDQIIPM